MFGQPFGSITQHIEDPVEILLSTMVRVGHLRARLSSKVHQQANTSDRVWRCFGPDILEIASVHDQQEITWAEISGQNQSRSVCRQVQTLTRCDCHCARICRVIQMIGMGAARNDFKLLGQPIAAQRGTCKSLGDRRAADISHTNKNEPIHEAILHC